jgi:hypothetical protein
MTALLQWMTADPARAFVSGAAAALVALMLPMAAWVPGACVVLALLAGGSAIAGATVAGAAITVLAIYGSIQGIGAAIGAAAVLLPVYLGARLLASSRNLTLVFQALTVGAVVLVVAMRAFLGDPESALAPLLAKFEAVLRQAASVISDGGAQQLLREIELQAVKIAWGVLAWTILLHTLVAQFAGLWAFGRLREPGLFGREFRRLKLGHALAWLMVIVFGLTLLAPRLAGFEWQGAHDVLFVLSAAFMMQALAVVHGLRELQVIGLLPMVLAYLAVVLVPMVLVGIGFADTWFRFRERFARR